MEIKNQNPSLLTEFLKELEKVPTHLTEALLNNSKDEDEKNVINSLSSTLNAQFLEISNSINQASLKSTKQGILEAEQVLKSSAALNVTKSLKLALPSIGSLFGKFGIQEIVMAIKKIIDAIFEALNKEKPKWLGAIENIIDEIINMLLGGDSSKVKNMLSLAEQNFIKEVTLVEKLNKVRFSNSDEDEDE
jgi:hypothetical protein